MQSVVQEKVRPLTPVFPVIPRSDLELGRQLGYGAYGAVFEGFWKYAQGGTKKVAVKKVFVLEKEAEILSKIRHRNIIQFYGVSYANPDFFILTEFAEGGSLFDRIHGCSEEELDFQQILKWAKQIANGVAYMHYDAPEVIIHRDLKSKNIVLSAEDECKICDFGTSKNLTHSWTAPAWGGTAAWMSPEMIAQKGGITLATDVWSYGVVLWELIHREIPYDGLSEFRIYSTIVQQGVTLVITEKCPAALADLMENCWKAKPEERFDMKKVIAVLEAVTDCSDFAIQCELFMAHKKEWKAEIVKQKKELEKLRIDYAKRLKELDARESALKLREGSQMAVSPGTAALLEDVREWDEHQVSQWIRHISPNLYVSEALLNDLLSLIGNNNITGKRLLDMTMNDWQALGISSFGVRLNLCKEIEKLDTVYQRSKNFPTLQKAQLITEHERLEKKTPPISAYINIQVVLYSRICTSDDGSTVRFKILVDTDWDDINTAQNMPPSHSMIKDILIVTKFDDQEVSTESCIIAPFVSMNWINAPNSFKHLSVNCSVSYTDCVIRPHTTRIQTSLHEIVDVAKLKVVKVELLLKPYSNVIPGLKLSENAGGKSFMRLDSDPGGSNQPRNVWRDKALSADNVPHGIIAFSDSSANSSETRSPLWSNVSSVLGQEPSPSMRSKMRIESSDRELQPPDVNRNCTITGENRQTTSACSRSHLKARRPAALVLALPRISGTTFADGRSRYPFAESSGRPGTKNEVDQVGVSRDEENVHERGSRSIHWLRYQPGIESSQIPESEDEAAEELASCCLDKN